MSPQPKSAKRRFTCFCALELVGNFGASLKYITWVFGCHSVPKPEKAMAPHFSTLAWQIPWTEKPGRLQSMGLLGVGHAERLHFHFSFHALEKEMATHSSVLAWRIPGKGEPGGLPSLGSHRVGHN